MTTATVCFKRKSNICVASRKCHIWNRRPWFAYSLCNFYGTTMMIKGSLLLSAPIVKHFRSKKTLVPFWAKIWRFWRINRGLKLNLSFITPKSTSLRDFTSFELSCVKIHPRVCPVAWSKKKIKIIFVIFHRNITYCPEAPSEWISTKFGIGGPLADIINCAEFFVDWFRAQGYWFCGGWNLPIPIGIEGRR